MPECERKIILPAIAQEAGEFQKTLATFEVREPVEETSIQPSLPQLSIGIASPREDIAFQAFALQKAEGTSIPEPGEMYKPKGISLPQRVIQENGVVFAHKDSFKDKIKKALDALNPESYTLEGEARRYDAMREAAAQQSPLNNNSLVDFRQRSDESDEEYRERIIYEVGGDVAKAQDWLERWKNSLRNMPDHTVDPNRQRAGRKRWSDNTKKYNTEDNFSESRNDIEALDHEKPGDPVLLKDGTIVFRDENGNVPFRYDG